jgi:WD40 repeat protein
LWSTKGGLVTDVHGELKSYGPPNVSLLQLTYARLCWKM